MENDEVGLHLEGAQGQMDARAVVRALEALLGLLNDAAAVQAVPSPPQFVVTHLAIGSIDLAVRPGGIVERETLEGMTAIRAGIHSLERMPALPSDWNESMVQRIISIGSLVNLPGVESAEMLWPGVTVRLDQEVLAHAQQSVSVRRSSFGSVRGRLDRWVDRGSRREVGLVEMTTGKAVTITGSSELITRAGGAIGQTVLAWGRIERNARGDKLRVAMDDFEVVEPLPYTPSSEMAGILRGWTGGMSSVDWVRAQRDQ